MGGNYFSPLADVLPAEVLDAMADACAANTHAAIPRDEPGVLSGIRGLLPHVVLKTSHDALIGQWVVSQRSEADAHREALRDLYARVRAGVAAELRQLEAVRAVVLGAGGRKTVPVADLRAALELDQ
jgi:hypothetical protein